MGLTYGLHFVDITLFASIKILKHYTSFIVTVSIPSEMHPFTILTSHMQPDIFSKSLLCKAVVLGLRRNPWIGLLFDLHCFYLDHPHFY